MFGIYTYKGYETMEKYQNVDAFIMDGLHGMKRGRQFPGIAWVAGTFSYNHTYKCSKCVVRDKNQIFLCFKRVLTMEGR